MTSDAELAASAYDRDTVRLTVTAGAATLWLQAVALQERADIAERNLQSAERLLALVESRARAGAATPHPPAPDARINASSTTGSITTRCSFTMVAMSPAVSLIE